MKCEEARELITAMIDGEITTKEKEHVFLHLKECVSCSNNLREEKALKRRVVGLYRDMKPGNELKEKIVKMINERTTTFPAVMVKQFPVPLFAGIGLALVLVIFFYIYFYRAMGTKHFPEKLITHAGEIIEEIHKGISSLDYSTSDPGLLEEYFKKHGAINFEVPVPDMRGAGYELLGGRIEKFNSIPLAISIYKSERAIVLNIMFEGIEFEGEEFGKEIVDERNGMEFYISSYSNLNSVAWWMGDELCVVVSTIPYEELIEFVVAGG